MEGGVIELFGGGKQRRDLNYVDDVVDALLMAGVSEVAEGETFNLGSERPISLSELAEELINLTGSGSVRSVPFPPERQLIDIGNCFSSYHKIETALGWRPKARCAPALRALSNSTANTASTIGILMRIAFLNLKRQYQELEPEIRPALESVLGVGVYILGSEVAAFEEEWAHYCGARFAASLASGTDALTLALIATGAVRPGHDDEVITSPLTAGYTALAILNAGARPVFADIDPTACTLDPQAIEAAVTPRTRAVLPVHLYGQMADITAIRDVAARHDLLVIEDAAQAHGARPVSNVRWPTAALPLTVSIQRRTWVRMVTGAPLSQTIGR